MDKDSLAASRTQSSWSDMHQFIGDLMASSTSANHSTLPGPHQGKDTSQHDVLRSAWESACNEALGLKAVTTHAQSRQTHDKGTPICGVLPLSRSTERNALPIHEDAQQFQHSGCNCPGCPFSSASSSTSTSSSLVLQTPKSRGHHPLPAQAVCQRHAKEPSSTSASHGLSLGLGLSLDDMSISTAPASDNSQPSRHTPQQQDKGTNTQSQLPPFPCLCCHRGFQTCAQLLHHQQGVEAHLAHYHHHHHHHHHCSLASCLPCPQLRPPPPSQSPPPFPCLSCQRTFSTCAQLLRHQQGHAQQEGALQAQHPCMHCDASFARPSQLLQHQRAQHATKAGGFLCTECGRAFNSHSNLRIHLNVHTGARPYACPECGKSFSQSGALKIHRRIHTGERPYTCAYCGRGFPHLAGVRAHQRTHTGEKPYCCPQCGKRFTQSGALKIHTRIHTGERPFVCNLCGKGFSNRSGIRFHHRTVHGIVPEPSAEPHRGRGRPGSSALLSSSSMSLGTERRIGSPAGSPFSDPHDLSSNTSPTSTSSALSSPCRPRATAEAKGSSFTPGSTIGAVKPPAGRGEKVLAYACEDCGLRFADAPSRNRHQAVEHYGEVEEKGGVARGEAGPAVENSNELG